MAYPYIATLTFSIFVLGVFFRGKRKVHIPLMLSAILSDGTLAVILTLERNVFKKALDESLNLFQGLHVLSSIACVLLYIAMIVTGVLVLRNKPGLVPLHRKLGVLTFFLKTLSFLTMFSMR